MKYPTPLDRIIANTVLSSDSAFEGSWCWIWTGSKVHKRSAVYGKITLWENGKHKTLSAHRASVIASGRKLLKNQVVRHLCNVPLCVNPAHLKGGTQSQNMKDWHKDRKSRLAGKEKQTSEATGDVETAHGTPPP